MHKGLNIQTQKAQGKNVSLLQYFLKLNWGMVFQSYGCQIFSATLLIGPNGNPFQYFCLGNPMNRGAWQVIVHGVAKSWTYPCFGNHCVALGIR